MIEDLKFFTDRLELAGPDGAMINRARAADRTTAVIKKWIAVSGELKQARQATISFCEAVEGKGSIISLRVADRPGFEAIQAQIKAQSGELDRIEHVIKALDDLGPDTWFTDLEDMVGSYGRVEFGERQRLANMASSVLSRRMSTGKTTEEILASDEDYQKLNRIAEEQISDANKQLSTLRPKLEAVRALLESVGC